MAEHGRSKNGVASLAYVPAIHALLADVPQGRRGCPRQARGWRVDAPSRLPWRPPAAHV